MFQSLRAAARRAFPARTPGELALIGLGNTLAAKAATTENPIPLPQKLAFALLDGRITADQALEVIDKLDPPLLLAVFGAPIWEVRSDGLLYGT